MHDRIAGLALYSLSLIARTLFNIPCGLTCTFICTETICRPTFACLLGYCNTHQAYNIRQVGVLPSTYCMGTCKFDIKRKTPISLNNTAA